MLILVSIERAKLIKMSIYTELAKARRAIPLTQDMLAERAQLSRMTVSNAEAGKDPQMSTVLEMARAMGMELMLVPRALRVELENFIQSGGRIVGQQSGVDAPKSVVESMSLRDPIKAAIAREIANRNMRAFLAKNPEVSLLSEGSEGVMIATPSGVFHPPGHVPVLDSRANTDTSPTNATNVTKPKSAKKSRALPSPKGR
jgi:DNA-binding XRE family transcriptional regulator